MEKQDFFGKRIRELRIKRNLTQQQLADKIKICKCNVDDNGAIAEKYGIMSIPAFIIFKGGQAVSQQVGATSPDEFKKWIEENI